MSALGRLARSYQGAALILLNTLLVFVALNVAASAYLHWRRAPRVAAAPGRYFEANGAPVDDGTVMDYLVKWFDYGAMPEMPPADAHELLQSFSVFSNQGVQLVPWVQFSEKAYASKHLNTARGALGYIFRATQNPPASPGRKHKLVYVFGGSTTFGYQAADDQTFPSRLSATLNRDASDRHAPVDFEVVNFGHCFYYSTQEMILALHFLKNGPKPDYLIFLDGVNEAMSAESDAPAWSDDATRAFRLAQDNSWRGHAERLAIFLKAFPLFQLVTPHGDPFAAAGPAPGREILLAKGDTMAQRYLFNVHLIQAAAREAGTKVAFFVQPDAFYNYPVELFRTTPPPSFFTMRVEHGRFHERVRHEPGIHYLGDLFSEWGAKRKAVVDDVHYSPAFNAFLAGKVAASLTASDAKFFR